MGNGVEDGNDFADRLESWMDCYIFTICICRHISRIHDVEHDSIDSEHDSDGSDVGVLILVRVDPFKCIIRRQTLNEYGVTHGILITQR